MERILVGEMILYPSGFFLHNIDAWDQILFLLRLACVHSAFKPVTTLSTPTSFYASLEAAPQCLEAG